MREPPVDVGPGEIASRPPKTGRVHVDLILALLAILMSAISLAVAFENGRTERGLLAASSWPFLREVLSNEYGNARDVVIGVSNGGVGPAKLKSLEVEFAGQPVASALELLRRCCALGPSAAIPAQLPKGLWTSVVDDTVLRPGEENIVVAVHRLPEAPDVPKRFAGSLTKIAFRACYCSILDECWTSDLRSTRTTRVDVCAPPAHPFDPNGP